MEQLQIKILRVQKKEPPYITPLMGGILQVPNHVIFSGREIIVYRDIEGASFGSTSREVQAIDCLSQNFRE